MPQELIDRLNSALEQEGFPPLFEPGMLPDKAITGLGILVWIGSDRANPAVEERGALQKLFQRGQDAKEAA